MEFTVEITATALADAENYVNFLRDNRNEPGYAERWWNGFVDAVLSLETLPLRCARIPEREHFEEELRHLIYGCHRIIFTVSGRKWWWCAFTTVLNALFQVHRMRNVAGALVAER